MVIYRYSIISAIITIFTIVILCIFANLALFLCLVIFRSPMYNKM